MNNVLHGVLYLNHFVSSCCHYLGMFARGTVLLTEVHQWGFESIASLHFQVALCTLCLLIEAVITKSNVPAICYYTSLHNDGLLPIWNHKPK